ncbi:hypothetical protein HBI68_046890 [Parastagonospora nodorum]|nr:hypothetical protein HBI72_077130 [Parastagonospora nodorum]KAH5419614.1 hypothetical protein HBI32_096180 [Parastagonospora nodorum]KAH6100811.1 hypothetical protein HBI69_217480 [Parastagonospora nodorum]KAH6179691.1 hypothetical protein HBI68_046890 [Parastagonospora nodorum]KAH6475991.1 hypothetical protein HBI59_000380 [Parastagonospora nodorum]
MSGEAQVALLSEYQMHKHKLTPDICGIVENANGIAQKEQLNATDLLSSMRPGLDELAKKYSVILAPSAVDEAPLGLGDMGSPVFNTLLTGLHVSVINIPAFFGANGKPVGISLVAARNHDQHLLKMARALSGILMAQMMPVHLVLVHR